MQGLSQAGGTCHPQKEGGNKRVGRDLSATPCSTPTRPSRVTAKHGRAEKDPNHFQTIN